MGEAQRLCDALNRIARCAERAPPMAAPAPRAMDGCLNEIIQQPHIP